MNLNEGGRNFLITFQLQRLRFDSGNSVFSISVTIREIKFATERIFLEIC